jgi:hypothetical protein
MYSVIKKQSVHSVHTFRDDQGDLKGKKTKPGLQRINEVQS